MTITMKIKPLLRLLSSEDILEDLTLEQLVTFMRLASHLHREILQSQKLEPTYPEEVAPESDLLPLHVA